MVHTSITRDLQDQAALHSLGLLDAEQAAEFEIHVSSCDVCRSEVRRFEEAAVEFALASAAEPPAELRSRVLAAIEDQPRDEVAIIRKEQARWAETPFPGVTTQALYTDPATSNITQLVRLLPGAHYPPHHHMADEQCYVIEGDVKIGEDLFHAGDFTVATSGSNHGGVTTRHGCLLLIVASPYDKVLASA